MFEIEVAFVRTRFDLPEPSRTRETLELTSSRLSDYSLVKELFITSPGTLASGVVLFPRQGRRNVTLRSALVNALSPKFFPLWQPSR